MKLQAIDYYTGDPLRNTQIQIQVKGKYSGFLSFYTDAKGYFDLDDQYQGQQISFYLPGIPNQWMVAKDGAKLYVAMKETEYSK